MELDAVARMLRRRRLTVLVLLALSMLAAVAMTLLAATSYRAQTTMAVTVPDGGSVYERLLVAQDLAGAYATLVDSGPVLAAAAESVGGVTVGELRDRVTGRHVEDTQLIVIEAEAASVAEAVALADAVGSALAATAGAAAFAEQGPPQLPVAVNAVEPAATRQEREGRAWALNMTLGLTVGLVLGAAVAAVREGLDRTVRHPTDVLRSTGHPVVGVLAAAHGQRPSPGPAAAADEAGAYLSLATRLRHRSPGQLPRRIVVTSALRDGDVADDVAKQLSMAFSALGARSLVIDGRPGLHEPEASSVGPVPTAQRELAAPIGGRDSTDVVLVAAPNAALSSQALTLAAQSGAALVVAHYGRTRGDDLSSVVAALEGVGAEVLGVVLHGVPARGPDARSTTLPPAPHALTRAAPVPLPRP